jgi:hypothetical protein
MTLGFGRIQMGIAPKALPEKTPESAIVCHFPAAVSSQLTARKLDLSWSKAVHESAKAHLGFFFASQPPGRPNQRKKPIR